MLDWRAHLTPDERERLEQISREAEGLSKERMKIYRRAKQRAVRARAKTKVAAA